MTDTLNKFCDIEKVSSILATFELLLMCDDICKRIDIKYLAKAVKFTLHQNDCLELLNIDSIQYEITATIQPIHIVLIPSDQTDLCDI